MHPEATILLAGAAAIVSALAARPAAAATSTPMRLHNKSQNLCLDPPGTDGASTPSSIGRLAACTASRDTYFVHTPAGELRNELKDRCLDNGARLVPCDGGAGQRWAIDPRGDGWFTLKNAASGTCLMGMTQGVDLASCGALTDERLWSWGSTGMALVNTHEVERKLVADDGLCVGIAGDATKAGAAIVRASCSSPGARWQLVNAGAHLATLGDPLVQVRSRHSGLCLEVPEGSTLDGVALRQATCGSGPAQRFALLDEGGGVKVMTAGGRCLGFEGDGPGRPLVQRTCAAGHFAAGQRFEVTGRRPQRIRNDASGLCLDAAYWAGGDGPLAIAPCDDGRDQLFVRNTDWELVSLAQGKCVDVAGTDAASGAQTFLWKCENADDQRWTFGGAKAEIKNKRSGRCLDLPGSQGKKDDPVKLYHCDGGPDQRWSWDSAHAITPPALPKTLTYTPPSGGKARVCAPWGGLCLEGPIAATGAPGKYAAKGDVAVKTPLGDWVLKKSDLAIDLNAAKIAGTAWVSVPRLGVLSSITSGAAQAEILIGPGDALAMPGGKAPGSSTAVATFARAPDRFYVYARLAGEAAVGIGSMALTLETGNVLLFEPSAPTVYLEGAAGNLPIPGAPPVTALGFSLGGCFERTLENKVRDPGGKEVTRRVCGHLLAAGGASYKMIAGTGTMLVDIDANRDGKTIFSGAGDDFRIAYDGATQVDKSILDLKLGGATIYYDGAYLPPGKSERGRLELTATGARENLFEGTPLAPLKSGGVLSAVQISADAATQRLWFHVGSGTLLGWRLVDVRASLGVKDKQLEGAEATATLSLPLSAGALVLSGAFVSASQWLLTGTIDVKHPLNFASGVKIVSGTAKVAPDGFSLDGKATLADLEFTIKSHVDGDTPFSLTASAAAGGSIDLGVGKASASGEAKLTITEGGAKARFKGTAKILGQPLANVEVDINSKGEISVGGVTIKLAT